MRFTRWFLAVATAFFAAGPPLATAPATAGPSVIGLWSVETGGSTGPCQIELQGHAFAGRFAARSIRCKGPLGFLTTWSPEHNGFTLFGIDGRAIARFAPARGIMTGRLADGSLVILRRADGARAPAEAGTPAPRGNGGNPCYIREDTGRCVAPEDTVAPRGPHPVKVRITGLMNIRREQSLESQYVGQVTPGQCIIVNACADTRWGVRCEIPMDGGRSRGFILKYYQKNGRNHVGFVNRC
ncbi:MAG: hypothetical protein ACK4PN_08890 [Allorhizobium sp.]|jgi:hypothetical protein